MGVSLGKPEREPERGASVVHLPTAAPPTAITLDPTREPSRARAALERAAARPLVPTPAAALAATRWHVIALGRVAAWIALHPWMLLAELRHVIAGIGWLGGQWARYVTVKEQATHAKSAEGNDRHKAGERVERRREARRRFSLVVALLAVAGLGWLALSGATSALAAVGVAALAVLDLCGRHARRPRASAPATTLPRSPLRDGMPVRMIATAVESALAGRGHEPSVPEGKVVQHGVVLTLHSPQEVTDDDLEAVERALQGFPGSVSRIQHRDNAAVGDLRIMWTDPLDRLVLPPPYAPRSQTVTAPGFMGAGWAGGDLHLNFLRTNMIIVAGPGGGKSSAGWSMMDYLTATDDTRVSVIDLSDGPFGHAWGDVVRRMETTPRGAADLLRESIDRAKRRTSLIAGRSRPTASGPAPSGDENWDPRRDGGAQHVIFIDELPLLAGSNELRDLFVEHQRIGRKAAENSIAMTQDLSGDTIKATSIRKYPSTTIMMPCSREDVIMALGGGMLKAGWRPDRLVPAEGDEPNDAGKAFVHSGSHRSPTPYRLPRLDSIGAIHDRALARIAAGFPALDDGDRDCDTQDAVEVPAALAAVEAVFAAAGNPERVASTELLIALRASFDPRMTAVTLAVALRPGLEPGARWRPTPGANQIRGYYLADVRAAIARLG